MIKIANGQGFWGDSIDAPLNLINYGKIDYLTLDYLAEVTLSIMQRQKLKNPNFGYASDFIHLLDRCSDQLIKNNIKIITNAGGANPDSCRDKLLGVVGKDIKIGVIKGDDIVDRIHDINSQGVSFKNLDTGESFDTIKDRICSANVYIDSFSIAKALSKGAQIVLAGRVSDPGLALGPMIHEFNWSSNDFNKLAAGTLAGHITECGAQCTGGNYTDWTSVPDMGNIGYPIIDIDENGKFAIIKPENTGGLINKYTISEQILYEMGNPEKYISPDVCVDFTSFKLNDLGGDCVEIDGVRGFEATDTFKVSVSYFDGYKASGQLTISGPDAKLKAELAADVIWDRLRAAGCAYDDTLTEYLGLSSCHGSINNEPKDMNEIVLRLSVKDDDKEKVNRFGKEIAPLITSGPPGVTGFAGGRPKAQEIISYWPTLIPKELVKTEVDVK